ncbi:MAG: TonB C-terminal domain-containing protein [Nitrospina sp.]|nr:TonB C-terminal domain-containing protein [Nitrospina sp.]MBT6718696.1 TonB C-terminal domain-containing protein [Nitrospina sp.]
MLVFSVFGHLALLTFVLFLPQPKAAVKAIVPAFMVNLVEISSGNKSAAKKKPTNKNKAQIRKNKSSIKKNKPPAKKTAPAKKVIKRKAPPKPNKIITELNKLDKKAAAVAPLPAKKMIEELDQLALLERPKKQVAKPKIKKPVLEETFRELEKLKDKKIKIEKEDTYRPVVESLLEDFEELKMEEMIEEKKAEKEPDPIKEKAIEETPPVAKKRDLLSELEKLAKFDAKIEKTDEKQTTGTVVKEEKSKAYDSVLEKFESLTVESSRVKVEIGGTKFDESKFQSRLRTLPDSPSKIESKSEDESYVFSDREGDPGADIQSLYAGLIQEKTYKNWRDPLAERHSKEAIISFHIFPKGNIDKPFIKQSSGVEALDTLAVRAVLDSVPFPHFPKELKMSNLFLSIYFKYVPKDE